MADEAAEWWAALSKLVTGLAEAEFERGEQFQYGGARLYPEDVADMLLPSIVCLAQGVSSYVNLGDFGFRFRIDPASGEAFPLVAERVPDMHAAPFHLVAPFVVEVFDTYVLAHRAEVARVFEAAAQTIHPGFTLEQNTRREGAWAIPGQQGPRV